MIEAKVLDKGFVRLVAVAASDQDVLDAARVSYKSESTEPERDRKLIKYLLDHDHGTPFEHAAFTFHVKLPIFCARQWIRHRLASYNETSFRYREVPDEFYYPEKWRLQDTQNKQGSVIGGTADASHTAKLEAACISSMASYRQMVDAGVAREMARMVLPVNLYTEWYFTVNARALMHFTKLRSERHAQYEMRQYSNALWQIWAPMMPWTAEAFLSTLDIQRYQAHGEGFPGPNLDSVRGPLAVV